VIFTLELSDDILDTVFPVSYTPQDLQDLLTVSEWEQEERKVLRGKLSRINQTLKETYVTR
jgi:hypothetical protein